MRSMRCLMILTVLALGVPASVVIADAQFYGFDKSTHPNPLRLVQFGSDPNDQSANVLSQLPGLPTDPVGLGVDVSIAGRLFAAPFDTNNTIFEISPSTGAILDSFAIPSGSGAHINGMAVSDSGLIYISQETTGGKI